MEKLSLFDLQKLAMDTEMELEENGGELTPEIEQALATTQEQIPQKIDGYKGYLDFLDAREKMLDELVKDIQRRKKAVKNAKENLKQHLMFTMNAFGMKKIKGNVYTATISRLKGMECDDDTILSPYRRDIEGLSRTLPSYVTIEAKVSRTELKNVVKTEGVLPLGVVETEKESLTIR